MKKILTSAALSWTLLTTVGVMTVAPVMPALAQETTMRILTVTGQGSESVQTTRAQVNLGVEVQGRTAAAVQQQVAQRSAAVVDRLRDRAVDQLQTTGIRLSPQYDYQNGRGELVGYIGANTVSFEVPTEAAGPLIDAAIAAGATEIQGISFIATDAAIAAAREAALREAVAAAQSQANVVLGTLNFGVEEIVGIQIDGASSPMPLPLPQQPRLAEAAADISTPVIGGEQTVNASVTLQIRY